MKKIFVFTNIDEKAASAIEKIPQHIDCSQAQITFVHYLNLVNYSYPGDMIVPFYPNDKQIAQTVDKLNNKLQELADKFQQQTNGKVQAVVQGSNSAKRDAVKLLTGENASLAVCITPKKGAIESFFHSSFTEHLSTHAPCDILMLRQSK